MRNSLFSTILILGLVGCTEAERRDVAEDLNAVNGIVGSVPAELAPALIETIEKAAGKAATSPADLIAYLIALVVAVGGGYAARKLWKGKSNAVPK